VKACRKTKTHIIDHISNQSSTNGGGGGPLSDELLINATLGETPISTTPHIFIIIIIIHHHTRGAIER
jgi:hypothetical protein